MIDKIKDFFNCFSSKLENKYKYLGYVYIPFKKDSEPYNIIKDFIIWLDKKNKPKGYPRWFLNLLMLYGMGNSIIKIKNRWAAKLLQRLKNYVVITDLKTKYGTMRIYGFFDDATYSKIHEVCEKVKPFVEIY